MKPAERPQGRVVRLCIDDEEEPMPRGIYERKKKSDGEVPPTSKPARKRVAARPSKRRPLMTTGPRFGVFDDGSVQISTATCTGSLAADDASALIAFIQRLKK